MFVPGVTEPERISGDSEIFAINFSIYPELQQLIDKNFAINPDSGVSDVLSG